MKSKHVILCLIGFIVFVHAHYFNSWINYYDAPMHEENKLSNMINKNSVTQISTSKNSKINSGIITDSTSIHYSDTSAVELMKHDSTILGNK